MERALDRLSSSTFDVIIIGGGVLGAFAAWDAAMRGLEVALVERGDFGAGTSASTLGILHGGLRYLQHLDVPRVRRSLAERSTWMRMAPHLTAPLPILVPTRSPVYRHLLHVAARLSDVVGVNRNRGLPAELRLEASRLVGRAELEHLFPEARAYGAEAGVMFVDGHLLRPERAILGLVGAAAAEGAAMANYVEVEAAVMRDGKLVGVHARDTHGDGTLEIRGRIVLNAAGAAASRVAAALGVGRDRSGLTYALGFNLTVDRPPPACAVSITAGQSEFGKRFFMVPWHGRTVLGTAHYPADPHTREPHVHEQEVERFLSEVNAAWPGDPFRPDEIVRVHAGLVPCIAGPPALRPLERHRIIDHAHDGVPGLLTAVTEKLTTARHVAQCAVDRICRRLDRTVGTCRTHRARLPGAPASPATLLHDARERHAGVLDGEVIEQLVAVYGTQYERILTYRGVTPLWDVRPSAEAPVIGAQFVHGVRDELALTPEDLLRRRTDVGIINNDPSSEALQLARRIIAQHRRSVASLQDPG